MRNAKRKAVAGVAAGITVAMLAAACGSGDNGAAAPADEPGQETEAPEEGGSAIAAAQRVGAMEDFEVGTTFRATEPISIDLLYRVHPGYPIEEDWLILRALEENQNVTFNREDVLMADWDQRRSLLVASGNFPTLVPVVWGGQDGAWWAGGNLLPISDYFDYMPNFQHFVQEWGIQDELDTRRQEDGRIYTIPGLREMPNIEHSFAINVDLFEAAGAPTEFDTFEDFAAALVQVQEHGDVDYAYSPRWNTQAGGVLGAALNMVGPNFGTSGGWNRNVEWFDENAGEFVTRVGTDGFRELIEFFAGLREQGVLDPEITQEDDLAISKFINGRSAVIETNGGELGALRRAATDIGVDLNAKMVVLPAGPAGDFIAAGQLGPGVALNSDVRENPNFLAILQFVDWIFFSEEGREFTTWGVEGETFERDAEGNRVLLEALGGAEANATEVLQQQFGFRDGVWMQTWGGSNDLFQSTMTPELREWHQGMAARKTALPVAPAAPLTEAENEEATLIRTAAQDATETGVAQFILGNRSMDEWDSFVAEVEAAGATRLVELLNTAYQRAN